MGRNRRNKGKNRRKISSPKKVFIKGRRFNGEQAESFKADLQDEGPELCTKEESAVMPEESIVVKNLHKFLGMETIRKGGGNERRQILINRPVEELTYVPMASRPDIMMLTPQETLQDQQSINKEEENLLPVDPPPPNNILINPPVEEIKLVPVQFTPLFLVPNNVSINIKVELITLVPIRLMPLLPLNFINPPPLVPIILRPENLLPIPQESVSEVVTIPSSGNNEEDGPVIWTKEMEEKADGYRLNPEEIRTFVEDWKPSPFIENDLDTPQYSVEMEVDPLTKICEDIPEILEITTDQSKDGPVIWTKEMEEKADSYRLNPEEIRTFVEDWKPSPFIENDLESVMDTPQYSVKMEVDPLTKICEDIPEILEITTDQSKNDPLWTVEMEEKVDACRVNSEEIQSFVEDWRYYSCGESYLQAVPEVTEAADVEMGVEEQQGYDPEVDRMLEENVGSWLAKWKF